MNPILPNEIIYCKVGKRYYEESSVEKLQSKIVDDFIEYVYPVADEIGVLTDDGEMKLAGSFLKQFNGELYFEHLDAVRNLSYGEAR